MAEKGGISVQTEHIFPIIKRWLYSDKEIFLREIVSNASDAIMKLKHLVAVGTAQKIDENYRIDVRLDKAAGTITVEDNGIGMSEEEVKQYINQIALSGALDFIQKYENASSDGIIGHFGLGFYSAFMVADTVELQTKSYTDAPSVHWTCTTDGEYEIDAGTRAHNGTEVVLHVTEDEKEFLEESRLKGILEKYCAFLPFPIYFTVSPAPETKDGEEKKEETPINEVNPLWQKLPNDCSEEEYTAFYHKVFKDPLDPLFHIHLNADYPLNFKGILYFPRLGNEYRSLEGEVKLFYNRVFVADNIKEVIPEYLLMLKGVLDCPELPLNVSRSYLQNSGYVSKISAHIVKKVCDKLAGLHNTDPEKYQSFWDDIKIFVEYGCIKDKKFYDRMKEIVLFKTTDGEFTTLSEYRKKVPEDKGKIYYASDPTQQAVYIKLYKDQGIPVLLLDQLIDTQFINIIELNEGNVTFQRIDSVTDDIREEGKEEETSSLSELFAQAAGKESLKVRENTLKDASVPAILNITENSRRMNEMAEIYGMRDVHLPMDEILVLNTANPLIQTLNADKESDRAKTIARQVYLLAVLNQRPFTAEEMKTFLESSYDLLGKI